MLTLCNVAVDGLSQLEIFPVKKSHNTATAVQSDEIAMLTDLHKQTTYCLKQA